MAAATIYKLLTRAQWNQAQAEGVYRGSAHDMRDGFIHFSTAAQLGETARKYFSGVSGLVLLTVDIAGLKGCLPPHPAASRPPSPLVGQDEGENALRWELSRGGDLFPHLYAPLPISAVKSVTAVLLAAGGTPIIPSDLER